MNEHPLQRAQRIAAEVQADPAWRDRPDDEAFEEFVRRVRAIESAETTGSGDRGSDDV